MSMSEQITIEVELNGQTIEETIPARTLLSEWLRDHQHMTGTHRGCETAKCGACTVMLDGHPVKSCNMLAAQADEKEVTTVEGLSDRDELHPVQQAFWEEHGMQCGFCTPGFVVNSAALLAENDDPTIPEIRKQLRGNICRCTGYTKIIESVQEAAKTESEKQ